jgi:ribonuclease E
VARPDAAPDAATAARPDAGRHAGSDAGPASPPVTESPQPDASSADADTRAGSDSAGPLEEVAPAAAAVVVTTTRRRRSASRPAGPPTLDTPAEASAGSTEPVEPAEPVEVPDVLGELDDAVDGGPVVHVPIKKKGVRKR